MIGALSLSRVLAEEPAAGKQVEQELKTENGKSIKYLLFLPKEYDSSDSKWPLLLFLHGRGESDGPLSIVKKWGPPRFIDHGANYHYVVVSPQCPPAPESWPKPDQQALLVALLDHICKTYKIDDDRVYLTGLSMGGYGTWRLAADHPERFAAVVPVCGAGNPADAEKLKNLPIWVWHGTEDPAVPFQRSVEMVDAIKKAGSSTIRFTTLEHVGHNCWEAAYATPGLYEWLNEQTVTKNRARANGGTH
ncbi:MAG TPA: prolyl oligopeptidase family serine peptidase [Verrucomicrobiae bacterium]|nr:prolyl oligopeptidase family serine peptidase [Verrucomicrobiae bacterium]